MPTCRGWTQWLHSGFVSITCMTVYKYISIIVTKHAVQSLMSMCAHTKTKPNNQEYNTMNRELITDFTRVFMGMCLIP